MKATKDLFEASFVVCAEIQAHVAFCHVDLKPPYCETRTRALVFEPIELHAGQEILFVGTEPCLNLQGHWRPVRLFSMAVNLDRANDWARTRAITTDMVPVLRSLYPFTRAEAEGLIHRSPRSTVRTEAMVASTREVKAWMIASLLQDAQIVWSMYNRQELQSFIPINQLPKTQGFAYALG